MKKNLFFMLCALTCICIGAPSCNDDDNSTNGNTLKTTEGLGDNRPGSFVVKFDGKYDYLKYVTVTYSDANEEVLYGPVYPAKPFNVTELKDGYFYLPCDYLGMQLYTDITFDEYNEMYEKGKLTEEIVKGRIVSTDYLAEEYAVIDEEKIMKNGQVNVDTLNNIIDAKGLALSELFKKTK